MNLKFNQSSHNKQNKQVITSHNTSYQTNISQLELNPITVLCFIALEITTYKFLGVVMPR